MEYVLKKYFKEVEIDEIDFVNQTLLFGESDDYIETEFIRKGEQGNWYWGESIPMEIDAMIETLNELKKQGANFVEVVYHCDHLGYVFNGLEMRKATDEEIAEHLGKQVEVKENAKQEKIAELEKELKRLKGD